MAKRTKTTDAKLKSIYDLLDIGWSEEKIAKTLGLAKTTVRYHKLQRSVKEKQKPTNPFSRTVKDYNNL